MTTEETEEFEQATAALLRERLTAVLPADKIVVACLPDVLDQLRHELLPLADRPLGEVLLDPMTNIAVLLRIKDYSKQLASSVGCSSAGQITARTIYFAAIASALVYHRQKISSHSYQSLHTSFATLAGRPWLTAELADLFRHANGICQQR